MSGSLNRNACWLAPLLLWVGLVPHCLNAQDIPIFPPISPPKEIRATEIRENLRIDGRLDEFDWQRAAIGSNFFQAQPEQGKPLTFDTQVRVLYNRKYLYVGAFCPDSAGRRGTRVPDLRRDFDFFSNDLFGLSLDPFLDKRNAQAFQTNPFSAQRDLLAFDDNFFDRDWDGYWKVRTTRTDSGWVAEIEIPWVTLRYPKPSTDSTLWGVNFVRIARRLNEQANWSPVPQAFTTYRMPYAGRLTGLKPPPPSVNIRVQPYVLTDYSRQLVNQETRNEKFTPKIGGDVKWAINPYTVLDLTANTDFAQADADRQVQNLTRFSVFFPERRQFFLENASLFGVGDAESQGVTPFFSRRIGLSSPEAGSLPLPIDFGARLVSRTPQRSLGGLLVKQRGINGLGDTWFGVSRYSQNFGKENRVGGLLTVRHDLSRDSLRASTNYTYSADAFFRITQSLSYYAMLSHASTRQADNSSTNESGGWSAVSQLTYRSNQGYAFLWGSLVTKSYDPGIGFVYGNDLLNLSTGGYRIFRPSWRPKWLRQLDPGAYFTRIVRASDGQFQQAEIETFPVYLVGVKGSVISAFVVPTWQQLDESFSPLGIIVGPGRYQYTRYRINYSSDQSARFSYAIFTEFGGYYNGSLSTLRGSIRYSPLAQVSMAFDYTRNTATGLGDTPQNRTTQLITPNVRLALNPRLQLIGFYQKNTAIQRDVWNVRLAWEFQPLSFLYIVYNSNAQQQLNNALQRLDLNRQEQVIGKLTYLKQF
jgi:hypothetical protein